MSCAESHFHAHPLLGRVCSCGWDTPLCWQVQDAALCYCINPAGFPSCFPCARADRNIFRLLEKFRGPAAHGRGGCCLEEQCLARLRRLAAGADLVVMLPTNWCGTDSSSPRTRFCAAGAAVLRGFLQLCFVSLI